MSCAPVYAQSGTGEVWGRVSDMSGKSVADAAVTVTDVDTTESRHTKTDSGGRFGVAALAPGHYQVTVDHDGFASRRQDDIVLLPGHRMQVDLPLRQAPLPETIALNPYPPIVESGRTHASAFVAETEIEHLPVIGLRYLRLAQLTPAVSQDTATGGVSVLNLPSIENRLIVDGFDHTSSLTGDPLGHDSVALVPYELSASSVQAYRIQTAAAPAENGRAAAAVIDVVTKSGANAFHGNAQDYFGDRRLNAQTALDQNAGLHQPAYRNNQPSALVGGPIIRNDSFFLVSYDGVRRTDDIARDQRQDLFLGRTDHAFAGQHLMLRYIDQQFHGAAAAQAALRTRSGAASLASAFGPLVNEARVLYGESFDDERPQASPSLVVWQGGSFVAANGAGLFGPHHFQTRRLEAADSISFIKGRHSIKVGADMLRDRNVVQFGPQTGDLGIVGADVTQYGGFVQDAWRATRALTVDLGARYDLQAFDGNLIRRARRDWAPRVGFAFSPGQRRHVFRAAYGLFYGSTPGLIPAFARTFDGELPASLPSMAVIDSSFTTPRVDQASVGWEFEEYRAGSFGIDYLFARGERLPRPVDINIGGQFPGLDRVVSFQSSGQSLYNGITLHTRARMLQQLFYTVAYTFARSDETPQQPIAMVFGGLNGRRSLAIQDGTLDVRAPGNSDRHHQLTVSAMYDTSLLAVDRHGFSKRLIAGWEFGMVYALQTGRPYSAYVNGDINGDRNPFDDLAPGTTWNQYRLPYQSSFDPRVARRFAVGASRQLSLIWEAFNLSNRPNYTAVDNTLYQLDGTSLIRNPLFGRTTAQAYGRMMQFAARITF